MVAADFLPEADAPRVSWSGTEAGTARAPEVHRKARHGFERKRIV